MIIKHRVNSIEELRNIVPDLGVEVDLRLSGNDIICSHDPFVEADSFYEWIEKYDHKFLIANIKSEGIEEEVFSILNKKKICNFFNDSDPSCFLGSVENMGDKLDTILMSLYDIDWVTESFIEELFQSKTK